MEPIDSSVLLRGESRRHGAPRRIRLKVCTRGATSNSPAGAAAAMVQDSSTLLVGAARRIIRAYNELVRRSMRGARGKRAISLRWHERRFFFPTAESRALRWRVFGLGGRGDAYNVPRAVNSRSLSASCRAAAAPADSHGLPTPASHACLTRKSCCCCSRRFHQLPRAGL